MFSAQKRVEEIRLNIYSSSQSQKKYFRLKKGGRYSTQVSSPKKSMKNVKCLSSCVQPMPPYKGAPAGYYLYNNTHCMPQQKHVLPTPTDNWMHIFQCQVCFAENVYKLK